MARSNSRGRNYVPFKWTKELIIFLSILAVAIILTIVCLIPTSKEKFMTEWSDAITAVSGTALDDDHVFEYISLSKFETKKSEATKDEPLIILYGSSTDSTTVSNISSINKKAQDYGIDKIYILKSDFVMNADETDSKDKAKLDEYKEALLGKDKASSSIDYDDIKTYCQLFVYTGADEYDFNSQALIDDKNNLNADFAKAMTKCFSKYTPKDVTDLTVKNN